MDRSKNNVVGVRFGPMIDKKETHNIFVRKENKPVFSMWTKHFC